MSTAMPKYEYNYTVTLRLVDAKGAELARAEATKCAHAPFFPGGRGH